MSDSDLAACPDDDLLLAYASGALSPAEAARVGAHVPDCDACCAVLAEAGRALADPVQGDAHEVAATRAPRKLPEPGDKVGRYHLLEVLGCGAMGVVYTAYDPELDRKVAVKLVRVQGRLGADEVELEARLLGEAQAMARLSHRNVVAVHDIGKIDAGIYLAMELVVGRTLRAWLDEAPRTWREIVDVFLQAGHGLAAAHEAGIVHRDFKPDNVLIEERPRSGAAARRERVLVTDFGLARVALREDVGAMATPVAGSDLRRTQAGTVIGTPAYMAPEQLDAARPIDARADVFAFGASLYEALYATRPYPGKTLAELERSLARGVPSEPPPSRVPARVKRVVMRALAGDPAERWSSMEALTRALAADPRKKLLRIGVPALAVLLAAGVVGATWHLTTAAARECRAGAERADAVWSPERREAARRAFGSGRVFAGEVFERASEALGEHLQRWRAARVEACDATHEHGEQSDALLDLRLACLDQRLAEADALAKALAHADADTIERAPEAVARLAGSAVCDEVERLRARVPPPIDPVAAAEVTRSTELRARASAAELTGHWQAGIALGREALAAAEAAGHGPTIAEALIVLGRLTFGAGDQEEARRSYERAIPAGLAAGDDRVVAQAAVGLSEVVAVTTRNATEALRWAEIGEAENERLGGERKLGTAVLLARAEAHFMALESDEALAALEQAVAMRSDAESPEPADALILGRLAGAYQQTERYPDALRTFARALTVAERTLGPQHPRTLAIASDYGNCLASAGRYGPAERELAAALVASRQIYPAEHRDIATLMHMRAGALAGLGRFDEAEALHREAIAIERKVYGDKLGQLALTHCLLAHAEVRAGRGQAALESLAIARKLNEEHLGGNVVLATVVALLEGLALEADGRFEEAFAALSALEPKARADLGEGTELALTLDGIGRHLVRLGRASEAVEKHRAALAMLAAKYPPDSLEMASTMLALGAAQVAAKRSDDARQTLERLIAMLSTQESDPLTLAEARVALAQAIADTDGARARRLVAEARAHLETSPYPRARRLAATIVTLE